MASEAEHGSHDKRVADLLLEALAGRVGRASASLRFNSVGQGLFYTARVGAFNLVYDCGSLRKRRLSKAIQTFRESLATPVGGFEPLHALVLSHLDWDHVSGLDQLLGNLVSTRLPVQQVFLPYLPPIERLALSAWWGNSPDWYLEFLAQPETYFASKDVGSLIFMSRKEGGDQEHAPPWARRDSRESTPSSGRDIRVEPTGVNQLDSPQSAEQLSPPQGSPLRVSFADDAGYWDVGGSWALRFFVASPPPSALLEFESCVLSELNRDEDVDYLDNVRIRKWIQGGALRERLLPCYHLLAGSLNSTTLVLYHGPVGDPPSIHQVRAFQGTDASNARTQTRTVKNPSAGFLLTGDFEPKNRRAFNEFMAHYRDYVPRTSGLLVPHHGSGVTWRREFATEFRGERFWYVSAGFGNQFKHPSGKVIEDILSSGGDLLMATDCWSVDETLTWM